METPRQFIASSLKSRLSSLVALSVLNLSTLVLWDAHATALPQAALNFDAGAELPTLVAQRRRRIVFRLSNQGVPVSRVGGAARGGCQTNTPDLPLTALTPLTENGGKPALVETISPYPTFFVYLPNTSAELAEFVLSEAHPSDDGKYTLGDELYHDSLNLSQSGGVVRVQLPENEKMSPLEMGKQYHWSFTLLCDPTDASANLFVEGIVQRVDPSPQWQRQLEQSQPSEQMLLYADNGYWFESLQTLMAMRQQNPTDPKLRQDWVDLLGFAKLDNLAQEPILQDWAEPNPEL